MTINLQDSLAVPILLTNPAQAFLSLKVTVKDSEMKVVNDGTIIVKNTTIDKGKTAGKLTITTNNAKPGPYTVELTAGNATVSFQLKVIKGEVIIFSNIPDLSVGSMVKKMDVPVTLTKAPKEALTLQVTVKDQQGKVVNLGNIKGAGTIAKDSLKGTLTITTENADAGVYAVEVTAVVPADSVAHKVSFNLTIK